MRACAACKSSHRGCKPGCIFARYFPSDDPQKFDVVREVFGADKVKKMLERLPVDQRGAAVSSLVYEANARMRDPVYGCVRYISFLENQLVVAQAQIPCIQNHEAVNGKEAFVFDAAGERKHEAVEIHEAVEMHEAVENRILEFPFDLNGFPFDLNEFPSDEDEGEDIMP
ncbi:hypothetical protein K1719_046657 [Acacia pycnantha]|nr:hypothetical protein K1719_046657 [Acacia pycnantha]